MTNQEIKTVGQTIAQETQIGGNTAARVGGVVEGIGVALDNKDAANGYYQATINGGTITVNAPNYLLGTGGNLRIKMPSAGTTASTLTIGNASQVQLLYNGAAVSAQNTWEADEIISVFYDGTRFMASNSQGGGGKAEKISYDNSQSGLAAESVQEALDEVSHKTLYNTVKCTRSISMDSPQGAKVDNNGIGLEVGKRYKFVINTSAITSDSLAVRLYQTSNKSSDRIKIGVFPTGTNQYTCYYTPQQSTNYQYFGLYKNQTTALDADCIVYEYDTNVTDKFNDIDDNIYLEKPFEQGTIATDGTTLLDVDTLIRSADFISIPKQVTIQAKNGYYIRRVFAYNPDGTLNTLLNTDAVSSYTLNDPSLKYKFTVQKGANEDIEINPDEDCMVWTSVKKLVGGSDTQGVAALNAGIRRIFVAAADSTPAAKAIADYQCTGVNDELVIQEAINSLTYGGTVQLLDGQYNIDSFPTTITWANETHHVAIFVTGKADVSRTVNLIGTTENKSYNSHYGAHIHVSQSAISNMNNTDIYTCIRGTGKKPTQYGDYTRITNMNFANFYLYIGDAEKKIRGIDCTCFGNSYIKQVGVYTEHYFYYRFNHLKPSTPVEGSIGVVANSGSNDEMARVGWDTLNCGGMYIGVMTQNDESGYGIDHLIMKTCTFARCVYGMYFKTGTPKTMTIINCCDEGCLHLPYFGGSGHITAIDFNLERFNNAYYPDDPTGSTEFYAVEETPGSWIGTIEYTLQGWSGASSGNAGQHFWKLDGSGKGIRTRNLNYDHTGYSRPNCGEYLEQYFDTTTNTWKTWNGSAWV